MCVQCGCLRPENQAGIAAAWADTARRQGERTLQEQINTLKAQVKLLIAVLAEHGIRMPEPEAPVPPAVNPNAARDDFYRQAGVKW